MENSSPAVRAVAIPRAQAPDLADGEPVPSRIPYPSLRHLSPAKHARAFGPGRRPLLNVSHMAMHASDGLWAAQAALGRATIDADLEPRLRELVILRVAYLQQSDYELFHHRPLAAAAGLSDADQSVLLGGDLAALAAADRALVEFVDAVVCEVSPTDTTIDVVRRHYSDRFVFDVIVVIGSYMMTARLAAVGGVQTEDRPVSAL